MVAKHAASSQHRDGLPRRARRYFWGSAVVAVLLGVGVFVDTSIKSPPAATTTVVNSTPVTSPVTTSTVAPTVTLAAVGDTELGNTPQLPADPTTYLQPIVRALAAPIVFGNLEGTMTSADTPKCVAKSLTCYNFRVPASYAEIYRRAGFNVLNSANNHAYDFGEAGVVATSHALRAAGITQAGLPGQIGVVREGTLKVAFVDFAPYYNTNNMLDFPTAARLISRAHQLANVVVVYMHAGAEGAAADHVTRQSETFFGENRGNPYAFAHAAINDGADLVLASGPHVLRGLQWFKGHLIDYSLGDFANYYDFSASGTLDLSAILHVTLKANGGFVAGTFTSIRLSFSGQPAIDPTNTSAKFVNTLSRSDFGASAAIIGPSDAILAPG